MSNEEILAKVDHTLLKPYATWADIRQICEDAIAYLTATVCIPPSYIRRIKENYGDQLKICTVIGFPLGYQVTEVKVAEAKKALEDGASEIDMVINIARMLEGDYDYVRQDIAAVVETAREFGRGVKVILEIGYLTDEQKVKACELAVEAGAEYVKSCTGFGPGKATVHDISLMKSVVGDRAKVKASGGVASLEDQWIFMECGADRVSARENILEQLQRLGIMGK